MLSRKALTILFLSSIAMARSAKTAKAAPVLNAPATLPIVFTKTISADHATAGDSVAARTTQVVRLANGAVIPSGSEISGHVVAATAFFYDKTPYARQATSSLSIHFDSVRVGASTLPLSVTVRAMADPITSAEAREPKSSDLDSLGTVTQIGGDQLTRSQDEVLSRQGDVVAYNRRVGVYAHLIASSDCDASNVEVSVDIYSASACGLYGFVDVAVQDRGSATNPSTLTLTSSRMSPKVWKHSTALLEVLPNQNGAESR